MAFGRNVGRGGERRVLTELIVVDASMQKFRKGSTCPSAKNILYFVFIFVGLKPIWTI